MTIGFFTFELLSLLMLICKSKLDGSNYKFYIS